MGCWPEGPPGCWNSSSKGIQEAEALPTVLSFVLSCWPLLTIGHHHCHLEQSPPLSSCFHSFLKALLQQAATVHFKNINQVLPLSVCGWWTICPFISNFISLTHSLIPCLEIDPRCVQPKGTKSVYNEGDLGSFVFKIHTLQLSLCNIPIRMVNSVSRSHSSNQKQIVVSFSQARWIS